MNITQLRRLLEMSYHYAWGNKGTHKLRNEWIALFDSISEQTGYQLGKMIYSGDDVFRWEKNTKDTEK